MARKLALLIGVSQYGDGFEPLSAPPKDVAAIQRVLVNPELGGFDPANIKTLLDPDPIEMQRHILELFTRSTKDDLVLLFFSGHGITNDDNHLYFCTRQTSKADYLATAVPAQFIQGLSNNSNYAKRQVIILDCCYSGAFAEGWQRKGDLKVDLERELGKEGRVVLTSSSSTQVSFQQEDGSLSLYTQYLIEGIETGAADADQDGEVKVRELHAYAKRKVQEAKPKMKPDIIVADDEGYEILLSRVRVDAASRFRQWVEKYADHERGEIRNRRCQEILDNRARELGISADDAAAMIASVLEPTRRRLKSLERYRQEYEEEVRRNYPLDEVTLEELREWQQAVLGLEDRDVAPIQDAINREQESRLAAAPFSEPPAFSTPRLEDASGAPQTNQTLPRSQSSDDSTLLTFQFETANITEVRKEGGIWGIGGQPVCEIRREKGDARLFVEHLSNGVTLEMVQIPGGSFMMGQTVSEKEELIRQVGEEKYQQWFTRELPRHPVKVSPFLMGKFPVTQAQYEVVMGNNPATEYGDNFVASDKPIINVSWEDAVAFCERLSQQTGRRYRLPSEAEWEYACRANAETPFYFGETITTDLANYRGTDVEVEGTTFPGNWESGPKGAFREMPTEVGSFPPNGFGLFDMHGNVLEWCLDHWHESYQGAPTDGSAWIEGGDSDRRILRGGSWFYPPIYCRSADRIWNDPGFRGNYVGFRVVLASA